MNHNLMAFLAMHPFDMNRSVYQKTFGMNDFYFSDGKGGKPLGNMQLVGKIDGNILKANVKTVPGPILGMMARRTFDYVLTTEDLPNPESRVRVNGADIILDWQRSNMRAMEGLERSHARALPRRRLSHHHDAPLRQAHAFTSVRHGHYGR